MGKIEEGGASVGSMLPVTPVDEVLSKTLTTESVDAEYAALQLSDKPENVPSEQDVELPAGVPQADDPMNPNPELPEEELATKEDIESLRNLEAEMESYFSDTDYGDPYEEESDTRINDAWYNYNKSYLSNMRSAAKSLNSKNYEECIKYANEAISDMKKCKDDIMSLHQDTSNIALNTIISGLISTLKFVAGTVTGFYIVNFTKTINKFKGLRESIKKDGLTPDIFDSLKNELVGACETNIKAANKIIKSAEKIKSKGFKESVDDGITTDDRLYLEDCMKEIDSLCKSAGIISPSTSVKEGEDLYVYEGCEKDGGDGSSLFLESGDKADIDEDIKPIIKTLNDKGYKTISSCSGHPSARAKDDRFRDGVRYKKLYSTARIVFDKIYDFPSIPEGWVKKVMEEDNRVGIYVDPPTFKIIDGLPEKNYANWKRRYMRSLEKWADELPNEGDTKPQETSDMSLESVMEDVVTDAMVGE